MLYAQSTYYCMRQGTIYINAHSKKKVQTIRVCQLEIRLFMLLQQITVQKTSILDLRSLQSDIFTRV
jgi:hypothetical protein